MAKKLIYSTFLIGVLLAATFAQGQMIDSTFTYQGQLQDNGAPANGTYSMEFILWDAPSGGNLLGSEAGNVEVTNGRFTRDLDFGTGAFDGNMRWLELEVDNVILSPRQEITATPYATYSSNTRGIEVNNNESFVGIGRQAPVNSEEFFGVGGQQSGSFGFAGMYVRSEGTLAKPFYGYQAGNGTTARHYITGDSGRWQFENGSGEIFMRAELNNGGFQAGPADGWYNLDIQSDDDIGLGYTGNFGEYHLHVNNDGYVGVGRDQPITTQSWFDVQTPAGANQFGGMYVSTDSEGAIPFYGYAAGGTFDCFHYYNGGVDLWGLRIGVGGDKITVRGDTGRVGISQPNPQFLLHVNGSAGKPGGGSWTNSSDRRLKKNIAGLEQSLDKLLKLRGVTFEYKDPKAINELEGQRIGVIAQEVEKVFPDWVDERADGYKAVTYRGFEAVVVEAIRELRSEKNAQIVALEDENDELRERLESLEAAVTNLTSK